MAQGIFLEVSVVTIRKRLIFIMLTVVVLAIVGNSIIATRYIDGYFKNYINERYQDNIGGLQTFAGNLLLEQVVNQSRIESELINFVEDPIVTIAILDRYGRQIVYAESKDYSMHHSMMRWTLVEEKFTLNYSGEVLGTLVVLRTDRLQNSDTVVLFKKALLMATLLSGSVVLLLALAYVMVSSKRMSKDLRQTARYAKQIETGEEEPLKASKVLEIKGLQMSLQNLSQKLKLQKSVQKTKVDQLAHESRTPLTILKTHLEGAIDGIVLMDDERLQNCLSEVDHLTNLLANLSEVITYESTDNHVEAVAYDLVGEIKKIMSGMTPHYKHKNMNLRYIGPNHQMVFQDQSRINQTLYNLLTNAYKFSEGGEVVIGLMVEAETLTLSVKDCGMGIAIEEIDKIFQPYYRSVMAQSVEGDGLGLYISKIQIEKLGGTIRVETDYHKGSVFYVCLPIQYGSD